MAKPRFERRSFRCLSKYRNHSSTEVDRTCQVPRHRHRMHFTMAPARSKVFCFWLPVQSSGHFLALIFLPKINLAIENQSCTSIPQVFKQKKVICVHQSLLNIFSLWTLLVGGDRQGIWAVTQTGCWFVGGDDLTGALHDL